MQVVASMRSAGFRNAIKRTHVAANDDNYHHYHSLTVATTILIERYTHNCGTRPFPVSTGASWDLHTIALVVSNDRSLLPSPWIVSTMLMDYDLIVFATDKSWFQRVCYKRLFAKTLCLRLQFPCNPWTLFQRTKRREKFLQSRKMRSCGKWRL